MTTCEICGTEFDEHGVQIVLPGLAKSFDRIDCAARARALAGPPAHNVIPAPAVFVDIAPPGQSRSYGLHGLPAGLAATLAGSRARLALGGASVAVALLVATTVHLSSRGGSVSDASARSSVLPSPARYAGDFADRASVADVQSPVARSRPSRSVETVYLAAQRSRVSLSPSDTGGSEARTRPQKRTAARQSSHIARSALTSSSRSISTRRGWGWGDKNHAHGGPAKSAGAGKLGKSHGHK